MQMIVHDNWQGTVGVLSRRELEFTLFVAGGETDKQIARRAGLAPDSVRKRVSSAMFKLGASRRAQLVAEAMRRGIITPLALFLAVCCVVVNSTPDHQDRAPRSPHSRLVRIKGGGARRDNPFFNPFDYV
ncbi:response regulator transcription factor [Pseudomonas neustonica]|uniref:response regulator transcription factor n=1 Tax=Pseudomonas neustonica TaxID=2487346 RepID=UPI003F45FE3B